MTNVSVALLLAALTSFSGKYRSTCELDRVDRRTATEEACLSCHDGSAAPAVTAMVTARDGMHPVGVGYLAAYRAFGKRTALVDPWRVDPAFAFPNGTVTCVTCHDAAGPGRLAVPAGRLCVACHDK